MSDYETFKKLQKTKKTTKKEKKRQHTFLVSPDLSVLPDLSGMNKIEIPSNTVYKSPLRILTERNGQHRAPPL
jgi:hypothetical protein